jgi:hypothetical protein
MFGQAMRYQQDAACRGEGLGMVIGQRRPWHGEPLRFRKHVGPPGGNRPDRRVIATWAFDYLITICSLVAIQGCGLLILMLICSCIVLFRGLK